MKKNILLFSCFLVIAAVSLKAQEIRPMPADSAYGVVHISVCNLREEGKFTSGMSTQALLGMPVKVLQYTGWYEIQTPDDYTGWVHRMVITPMSKERYDEWNRAEKIVVTSHYGFAYEKPDESSQPVSDVVAGNRLKWEGSKGHFYKVSYPDGRKAYISKSISQPETKWRASLKQDVESIIATAYSMMGVPYLWAGTSSKGVDCSGLVRTVLFMHDIIIPRDASQQAYVGEHIEIAPDFANVQRGDLVFFGRKATAERKEGISHVGIYLGNKQFIHALGDVHISSMNPADKNYDEFNTKRLLFAVRFLPYINKEKGMNTIPQGNYSLTVRATNSKNAENPADATFTLNIIENPNYFTDIRYGNNIDVPEENNANQFRITEDNEANADATLKGFTFPSPQTGLKGDVSVAWSIKNGNKCDNLTIDSNTGKISFNQEATWPADNKGVKANTIGFCYVTATAGTDKDSQISQTTLVFIHYDLKANNGVHIHYNPFVFQADPKNGGNSTVPLVTVNGTTTTSNFALDYRRSFNYYPTEGTLVKGAPATAGSFLNELWTTYYKAMDIKLSTGSRNPMSYYGSVYDMSHSKKLPNQSDRLSVALAYVVPNDLTIHISPNIWKNSKGEYANGIMVGEMTFLTNVTVDTKETGDLLKDGKKIAPIIIWFDKKFIK